MFIDINSWNRSLAAYGNRTCDIWNHKMVKENDLIKQVEAMDHKDIYLSFIFASFAFERVIS